MMRIERDRAIPSRDPFGELKTRRGLPEGLRQRFPDRVLVMTTDGCFCACPHCTRKFILGKTPVVDTPQKLAACVAYVQRHPKVRDVLLSGGDVLTLSDVEIRSLVNAFAALPQVEVIRICTRAPVVMPLRLTAPLLTILARSRKVWMNIHVNTADEAKTAGEACCDAIDCGIPVSSQTVLLRGINDTPRKMLHLLQSLSAARIRPYYVFQCDPVLGLSERYGVPLEKAKAIEKYCAERIGGLALPRFVADLPGSRRKMPLDLL